MKRMLRVKILNLQGLFSYYNFEFRPISTRVSQLLESYLDNPLHPTHPVPINLYGCYNISVSFQSDQIIDFCLPETNVGYLQMWVYTNNY